MMRNRKELRSASVAQSVVAGRRPNKYMVEAVVKLVCFFISSGYGKD